MKEKPHHVLRPFKDVLGMTILGSLDLLHVLVVDVSQACLGLVMDHFGIFCQALSVFSGYPAYQIILKSMGINSWGLTSTATSYG